MPSNALKNFVSHPDTAYQPLGGGLYTNIVKSTTTISSHDDKIDLETALHKPRKKKLSRKMICLIVAAIVVLIVGVCVGAYFWDKHATKKHKEKQLEAAKEKLNSLNKQSIPQGQTNNPKRMIRWPGEEVEDLR
jgi:hypothetical protein